MLPCPLDYYKSLAADLEADGYHATADDIYDLVRHIRTLETRLVQEERAASIAQMKLLEAQNDIHDLQTEINKLRREMI